MLSLLSKERIVAPPGYNRWKVPPASIAIHLCIGSVERSSSNSARSLAIRCTGARTPSEKVQRPFFFCTVQVGPTVFTRRVSAASPGGNTSQPGGT